MIRPTLPRCPEHGQTLTTDGACPACRADHLAGEHRHRTPTCTECPPAPDTTRWLDTTALAAGDRNHQEA